MAWERGYYYRVRRENGRVVREYLGGGRPAELIARLCTALGVKCTAFDGCEFAVDEESRRRGRPRRDADTKPAMPAPKKKKKSEG